MQNDSVKANYPESLTFKKGHLNLFQQIENKLIQSASQFHFINFGQWLLLGMLNIICWIFIIFACMGFE